MKKINLNDANAWSQLNWDEPEVHPLLKRNDAIVNRSRSALTKRDNPVFSATMSETAHKRNESQEYVESQLRGVRHNRNNTYQAQDNARLEKRAQISATMKGMKKSDEHLAKLAAKNKERSKTIQTPYGIFESRKLAVDYMVKNGVGNASRKLDNWLKTKPTEFYYIDK